MSLENHQSCPGWGNVLVFFLQSACASKSHKVSIDTHTHSLHCHRRASQARSLFLLLTATQKHMLEGKMCTFCRMTSQLHQAWGWEVFKVLSGVGCGARCAVCVCGPRGRWGKVPQTKVQQGKAKSRWAGREGPLKFFSGEKC